MKEFALQEKFCHTEDNVVAIQAPLFLLQDSKIFTRYLFSIAVDKQLIELHIDKRLHNTELLNQSLYVYHVSKQSRYLCSDVRQIEKQSLQMVHEDLTITTCSSFKTINSRLSTTSKITSLISTILLFPVYCYKLQCII